MLATLACGRRSAPPAPAATEPSSVIAALSATSGPADATGTTSPDATESDAGSGAGASPEPRPIRPDTRYPTFASLLGVGLTHAWILGLAGGQELTFVVDLASGCAVEEASDAARVFDRTEWSKPRFSEMVRAARRLAERFGLHEVHGAAWSVDGAKLVVTHPDGLYVSTDGGRDLKPVPQGGYPGSLFVTADGAWAIYDRRDTTGRQSDPTLVALRMDGASAPVVLHPGMRPESVAREVDGQRVVASYQEQSRVCVDWFDVPAPRPTRTFCVAAPPKEVYWNYHVEFSPQRRFGHFVVQSTTLPSSKYHWQAHVLDLTQGSLSRKVGVPYATANMIDDRGRMLVQDQPGGHARLISGTTARDLGLGAPLGFDRAGRALLFSELPEEQRGSIGLAERRCAFVRAVTLD